MFILRLSRGGAWEKFFIIMIQWLVEQFVARPVAAFISSIEILGEGLQGGQTIDAIVGRVIHTLSCASNRGSVPDNAPANDDREGKR